MGLIDRLKRNALGSETIVRKKATNKTVKKIFYRYKKGTFCITARLLRTHGDCFNKKQRKMIRDFMVKQGAGLHYAD